MLKLKAEKLAYAAGMDAANRSMRKANRKHWNRKDYSEAIKAFNRIAKMKGRCNARQTLD